MPDKDTIFRVFVAVVAGICGFAFFRWFYPCHLEAREQIQLLLFTPGCFVSYLEKPAWLAVYLADCLEQFFCWRNGGVLLMVLLLVAEWWLAARFLRRLVDFMHIELYALFLFAAEVIMLGQLTYPLSVVFSLSLTLLGIELYMHIRTRVLSVLSGVLLVLLLYSTAGFGVYLFLLMLVLAESKQGKFRLAYWLFLAAESVVIPLGLKKLYALPGETMCLYPIESVYSLCPTVVWIVLVLGLCFVPRRRWYMSWKEQLGVWMLSFLFLYIGLGITTDFRRERLLALDKAYTDGRWSDVLRLSERLGADNRLASYYRTLALLRSGQLPDALLNYAYPAGAESFFLPWNLSDLPDRFSPGEVYYALKDWNMARYAVMRAQEKNRPDESIRLVKRLAEISRNEGDTLGLEKYQRIMERTLFYSSWAKEQTVLPDTLAGAEKNRLRDPSDFKLSLYRFVESDRRNKDAVDYLLCYCLVDRDLSTFAEVYRRWGVQFYPEIPRIYAEALLMQMLPEPKKGRRTKKTQPETFVIPEVWKKAYADYLSVKKYADKHLEALQVVYGKSYWYYYDLSEEGKR